MGGTDVSACPRQHRSDDAHALAKTLISRHKDSTLIVRDLAAEQPKHIDDSFAIARNTPPEQLSPSQRAVLELSDALVSELKAADVIIVAAGMINFGIPSTLKSYIDHILRPGATFRYTEKGSEGFVHDKKVYLVVARGGIYSEGPLQALNFQDTYLKVALGFIGLTDIEVITVEGVAFGADAAAKAVNAEWRESLRSLRESLRSLRKFGEVLRPSKGDAHDDDQVRPRRWDRRHRPNQSPL